MESEADLQDLFLSVFSTLHTFNGFAATKIIENHLGKALVKMQQIQAIPVAQSPPHKQPIGPAPAKKQRRRNSELHPGELWMR